MASKWETGCDGLEMDDYEALYQHGFTIGKLIGRGCFAPVYLVHARNNKISACKVFDRHAVSHKDRDKFFKRELNVIMQVNHPNIIALHGIFQRGSKVFILMRYAERGDLLDYIQKNGPTDECQAKIWFSQLVSAVDYLHKNDIAHRDLKCENILLTKNLTIKLADFGFARYCTDIYGKRELSRTFCGSAIYAAPEIVASDAYNPKLADIWSLGIVLFIILNATMPFEDTNLGELLKKQLGRKWSFEKSVKPKLSNSVKLLVRQILEPDVTKRLTLDAISKCDWLQRFSHGGDH